MPSAAYSKFKSALVGAQVLAGFCGTPSMACSDPELVQQTLLKASVAHAVGCWEGYLEAVLREFVSKTRVQAHRRSWTLIVQFEALVDQLTSSLNTPNWEQSREIILNVTGMDPYPSWIWQPTYSNQTDTKEHFDGIVRVRHSFAHGFPIPNNVRGLKVPGQLDADYVRDAIICTEFFANATDELLAHELGHRHGCATGWS